MPSFSTSLSGLNANSLALSVIANNLANLNTIAYKGMTPNFRDLFYQQVGSSGSGNPVQIGVGTVIGSISSLFTQGSIESSGVPTDVAVQGDGFFQVDKDGLTLYTRAGNFSVDTNGFLVTEDGGLVLGLPAVNGVISPNQTPGALVVAGGQISPPKPTGNVQLAMNLDASAAGPISALGALSLTSNAANGETVTIGSTTYTFKTALSSGPTVANEVLIGGSADATLANLKGALNHETTGGQAEGTTYSTGTAANSSASATGIAGTMLTLQAITGGTGGNSISTAETMSNGSFASATLSGGTDGTTFSTAVAVYDALGASHVLNCNFTKTAANTWDYDITIPGADVGSSGAPVVVKSGSFTFDGAGQLTSPSADITGITITGFTDGADPLTFTWKLLNASSQPTVTQVAGPSATSTTWQDGFASGTLLNFVISGDGVIQGIFSNGQTLPLGQIVLATFPNAQGLQRAGANNFMASLSSGLPNTGVPGTGGRGALAGGALERSNVDISREFAQLILAQRGFQANARVVTTLDEVTQEAINLKR